MLHVDRNFQEYYEEPQSPFGHYIVLGRKVKWRDKPDTHRLWRFDIWGLLFDPVDGIFRRMTWDTSMTPSWGNAVWTAWNNVCQKLTPWYHPRRCLLNTLINENGMKYLYGDRKSIVMRTRGADIIYFEVRCRLLSATAKTMRFVEADTGNGRCTFLVGADGTLKEEKTVSHGPCLTWAQCDRLLTDIVGKSPELGWSCKESKAE